jgi:hypothetical protein
LHDKRPVICLGAYDRHTPAGLLEAAYELFAPLGSVATNQPFRGTYIPLRRDSYLRDEGAPDNAAIDRFATAAGRLIDNSTPA